MGLILPVIIRLQHFEGLRFMLITVWLSSRRKKTDNIVKQKSDEKVEFDSKKERKHGKGGKEKKRKRRKNKVCNHEVWRVRLGAAGERPHVVRAASGERAVPGDVTKDNTAFLQNTSPFPCLKRRKSFVGEMICSWDQLTCSWDQLSTLQ